MKVWKVSCPYHSRRESERKTRAGAGQQLEPTLLAEDRCNISKDKRFSYERVIKLRTIAMTGGRRGGGEGGGRR